MGVLTLEDSLVQADIFQFVGVLALEDSLVQADIFQFLGVLSSGYGISPSVHREKGISVFRTYFSRLDLAMRT